MTAFNAGEVTPLLEARTDFEKFDNSCRTLQNMLVLTQGPVTRRPGTKYIAETKTSSNASRLLPFEFSKSDAYILEFGNEYMRVYRNGGVVLDGASPFELATDFLSSELYEIQFVQSENIMYLVHGEHTPQKMTRADHDDWTIEDANFETGPFIDDNITDTTIAASGTTGTVTLIADANIWTADHVGALWRITHRTEETSLNGTLDANESSSTIPVSGGYDFTTHGTWTATVRLERSFDSGATYEAVTTRHSEADDNISFSDTEEASGVIYRVTMTDFTSGAATFNLSVFDSSQNGIVRIASFVDANEVTATVISEIASTDETTRWAEGYWSDERGWPQTVEFHQERILYGGSESFPQTVWASESSAQYENMTAGLDDDDAFVFVLPGQNPIQWMLSQSFVLMGTTGGAGRLGRPDEDLTPTTPEYRTQAKHGSAYIQALLAGDAVLFIERGGTKVRELVFSLERDRFVAPDLTILSEHITDTGIIETAYQSRPESVMWAVRDDGVLLSLTYEQRDQGVVGWARHVTDGDFESVATIPGPDEDELWVIVKRSIDGSDVRYVERLQPRNWDSVSDSWYVDSGLAFDGGDSVSITGITQADPAVVTVSTWPVDGSDVNLADGDQIIILGVNGMTEVNGNVYTVDDANISGLTFSLEDSSGITDINSVDFTTYISVGTVQRVEKNFTDIDHLEGEEVVVLADGGTQPTTTVTNGAFSISEWSNIVVAGLSYTSVFETMPIFFNVQTGSSIPNFKTPMTIHIDFFETLGAQYGVEGDVNPINFDGLTSGFKHLSFPHGIWDKAAIYVQESLAVPQTIRGVYIEFRWSN